MTENNRQFVVVLGMHRSGTSALAGVLHHLGISLGQRLMPGAEGQNQKGFFENAEVYQLNEGIHEVLGVKWDGLGFPGEGWQHDPKLEAYRREALRILRDEFEGQRICGLKDPRFCRLLPFWLPLLKELGGSPAFVLALRHPKEVAASLARRDHMSMAKATWLWLDHFLSAERASRGLPRVVVAYRRLLEDWRATTERISQGLSLSWPHPADEAAAEIDEFLSGDLRHHRFSDEDDLTPEPIHEWVAQTYRALREESTNTGADSLDKSLGAIQESYATAMALMAPRQDTVPARELDESHPAYGLTYYIRALYDRDRHIRNLESMMADRDKQVRNLNGQLKNPDSQIGKLEATISQANELRESVSQLSNRLLELDQDRGRFREEMEAQRDAHERMAEELRLEADGYRRAIGELLKQSVDDLDLSAVTELLREDVKKRNDLSQRITEWERQNTRLRQDLEARERAFDNLCKTHEEEREQAAEEKRRIDLELSSSRQRLVAREEEVKAGNRRISELERDLGKKEKETGGLRMELSKTLGRIDESQKDLEQEREKHQKLQEIHSAAHKKLQQAEAEKNELQQELEGLRAALEETRTELRNLEAAYREVRKRPWYKIFTKVPEP